MNKFILALVLVGALVAPALASTISNTTPYVRIEIGNKGVCSGVYIGNGDILTAAHCATTSLNETVVLKDGRRYISSTKWAEEGYDIAVLHIQTGYHIDVSVLNCNIVPVGTTFKAFGNPLSESFLYTRGEVVGEARRSGPWKSAYPVDASIMPGQSGGADIDSNNQIIGITVGVSSYGLGGLTGLGWIVPSVDICNLINKHAN